MEHLALASEKLEKASMLVKEKARRCRGAHKTWGVWRHTVPAALLPAASPKSQHVSNDTCTPRVLIHQALVWLPGALPVAASKEPWPSH